MTAIIGILNKKGIAIAADSASTFKEKIVNTGNKILRLSDVIPAAIMIVNCSTLASMPWEVIIRWYRKENGKVEFDSLEDCIEDFLEFVDDKVLGKEDIDDMKCDFRKSEEDASTNLVFAGYGAKDTFPKIFDYWIYGIDRRKIMFKQSSGYKLTSDDKEITIYAQGQPAIIKSYINGVIDNNIDKLLDIHLEIYESSFYTVGCEFRFPEKILGFDKDSLPSDYVRKKLRAAIQKSQKESEDNWLKAIKEYNLQEMASLAENLIKATELHKKIYNEEEQVGGLIDLAVITKNDGFQWLNRKSWDDSTRGGQYGKFGI